MNGNILYYLGIVVNAAITPSAFESTEPAPSHAAMNLQLDASEAQWRV